MVAQVAQNHGVGAIGLDLNSAVVHLGDGDKVLVVQVDFGKALSPLEGSYHIVSGHGVAVVELDAFLDLEVPGALVHILIALHQMRLGLQIHIDAEEHAVSQLVHIVASHSVVLGGRQRGSLTRSGDDDAVLVAALGDALLFAAIAGAASQQAQQHHCGQKQAEQPNFSVSHVFSPHIFNRGLPVESLFTP